MMILHAIFSPLPFIIFKHRALISTMKKHREAINITLLFLPSRSQRFKGQKHFCTNWEYSTFRRSETKNVSESLPICVLYECGCAWRAPSIIERSIFKYCLAINFFAFSKPYKVLLPFLVSSGGTRSIMQVFQHCCPFVLSELTTTINKCSK